MKVNLKINCRSGHAYYAILICVVKELDVFYFFFKFLKAFIVNAERIDFSNMPHCSFFASSSFIIFNGADAEKYHLSLPKTNE